MNDLRFFNPYAEIRETENRLPYWQQEGAVYFVTFRLADSVPCHLLGQWADEREAWLGAHPEPWSFEIDREYHRRFSGALERWLDEGRGAWLLRRNECAEIVMETLRHFEGERVVLLSGVVMPNHVHCLFVQNPEWPLEKLVRSWRIHRPRKQQVDRTVRQLLATRLLRSPRSRRKAFCKLRPLHPAESKEGERGRE
jgi:putative transposase